MRVINFTRQLSTDAKKVKKTKKGSLGLSINKTDCKGSNFRGLCGLSDDEMTQMLQKCANGEIALQKLNSECSILKKMKTIKEALCLQWDVKIGSKQWSSMDILQMKRCSVTCFYSSNFVLYLLHLMNTVL